MSSYSIQHISQRSGILLLMIIFLSCNKENNDQPANSAFNNLDECVTCPSDFFANTPEIIITNCDDFTADTWPNFPPDTIGYTQDGIYPIVQQEESWSGWDPVTGYQGGILDFHFSGYFQVARFTIHDLPTTLNEVGVQVNGDPTITYMSETFPKTLGDVVIDFDLSPPDVILDNEAADLIIAGPLEKVRILGIETYYTALCVSKPYSGDITQPSATFHFETFKTADGSELFATGFYPENKTPKGYYGLNPATLYVDFSKFLAYTPGKIGFVRASNSGDDNFSINIQLPGTPLVVTTVEELESALSPYGYEVEIHTSNDGLMWQDVYTTPSAGNKVDSILIKGNNITEIRVGIDMSESELRNICTYYE